MSLDVFEKKELSADSLKNVSILSKALRQLGLGKGNKKEATVSKIKNPLERETVLKQTDFLEKLIETEDISILAIIELSKRYKNKYNDIAREKLPAILNDVGLKKLTLSTGEIIEITDILEASVSQENAVNAYLSMVKETSKYLQEKYGKCAEDAEKEAMDRIDNLFKKQIIIDSPTDELKAELLEKGVLYDRKFSIHWQTLRKYCKAQRAEGRDIPEEIAVFEYTEAVLK